MNILGLDVGMRRTGVAIAMEGTDMAVALPTLRHLSDGDVSDAILSLCAQRNVRCVVLGLPLLPSGKEGEQVTFVHAVGEMLQKAGIDVEYLDERYTSKTAKGAGIDPDSSAAVLLLQAFLDRKERI